MLLCGCLAAIAGTVIILCMPLAWVWRVLLAAAFVGKNLRELLALVHGHARLLALRLDAGGRIEGIAPDGRIESLTLLNGSTVLGRLAWLRVAFPDGSVHGELLAGDPARDLEWKRLHLIWRYRRAAFGRPPGS